MLGELHIGHKPLSNPQTDAAAWRKCFFATFVLVLLLKFALAGLFPLTGDEAYYWIWGKKIALGYYDHTPMIGWMLHPLLNISDHVLMLRAPVVILGNLIALLLYLVILPYDEEKASLIGLLYLLSPIPLLGVLITTDTPLVLFCTLSGLSFFYALKNDDHLGFYALAGLGLGLAFASKYFAVLLALAYLVFLITNPITKKRCLGFAIGLALMLPFGIQNLIWNYHHDWANILFNIYNRNSGDHASVATLGSYLATVFYIITPPLIFALIKYRKYLFKKAVMREFHPLTYLAFVPLGFYLVLSPFKEIGLHWPLGFIAFIYLFIVAFLSQTELKRCLKWMVIFSGLHIVVIVGYLVIPVQFWKHAGFHGESYANTVFIKYHAEIRKQLGRYDEHAVLTSPSYAKSDLFYYDSGIYSPMFGVGTAHGRQGDFTTDYKQYANKDFVIFNVKQKDARKYQRYFDSVEIKSYQFKGATFYLTFGHSFNYLNYRDSMLSTINSTYWQVPHYLPSSPSFYCLKYFSKARCDRERNGTH